MAISARESASATPTILLRDEFWSKYEKLIRTVTLPYQYDALNDRAGADEPSGAIHNFRIAAGLEKGDFYGLVFQDSDLYKWIEGAAYSLRHHPDAKLEHTIDEIVDLAGKAQQPDGYLDTYFIIKGLDKRWTNLHDCHELYCAGHLMEAAAAYAETTGKTKLLAIACRLADHIGSVFGPEPNKRKGYPGHQEVELGLVRLYHATGERRYLDLSAYFLRQRGALPYYFDEEWEARGRTNFWSASDREPPSKSKLYNQTQEPAVKQSKAVGHAVRLMYMCTAMAALAADSGDEELGAACRRLWDDIEAAQMYLTGGVGSTCLGEAFTFDYDLPNDTNYAETCASIGLVFFARQMLRLTHNSRYADVMERALYNTILASMSLDGRHFFYVNPLEVWPEASEKDPGKAHVKAERQSWFGCACCPPNLVRLVESLGDYIYTLSKDGLWVNLYIGSSIEGKAGELPVRFEMRSSLPRTGDVHIEAKTENAVPFPLFLRLPAWCRSVSVRVNGADIGSPKGSENGYLKIDRTWANGDIVELHFDMPIELIEANPLVRADAGKVAIQRGPVVYCLEEADNGANLSALSIDRNAPLAAHYEEDLLGGTVVVEGGAKRRVQRGWGTELYRPLANSTENVRFRAVPYSVWGNRGKGEMAVWLRFH